MKSFNYSENEKKNITSNKIKIAESNQDIINFVFDSLITKNNSKLYLSKLDDCIAENIYYQTGVKVDNYNISLRSDIVKKIFKSHGDMICEYKRKQINITINDFLLINYVVGTPDIINLSNMTTKKIKA